MAPDPFLVGAQQRLFQRLGLVLDRKMAVGLGARVTILDMNAARMAYLDDIFGSRIVTMSSTEPNIREAVAGEM